MKTIIIIEEELLTNVFLFLQLFCHKRKLFITLRVILQSKTEKEEVKRCKELKLNVLLRKQKKAGLSETEFDGSDAWRWKMAKLE